MTLRQYLQLILKYRYLLALGVLAGLGLGVFGVATTQKSYRGVVSFFVSSTGEGTVSSANLGDQFALRRVNSYIALLRTDRLARLIVDDTGTSLSPVEVRRKISGNGDMNTVLLTARVSDPNADRALEITESLARTFPELVADVERPTVGDPTVRLEVVSGPAVIEVSARVKWILATRVAAGIALAVVLAAIRELTDNRLHSIDRALAMARVPLLGLITNDRRAGKSPLILNDGLGSVRAEEYRQVRTSLQFVDTERRAKVIVVTSSVPSEGKSVTAANLAIAVARSGLRVALVDADLRKPMVGKLFGIEQSVGLVDALRGQASLDDVLQRWGEFDLALLPSGGTTSIPSELLGTVAATRLVSELRSRFDFVIIDSPPLVPVTDGAIVSTLADGVVLLVRPDKVTKQQLQRSLGHLERVRANLLGIVGSMIPERSNPYSGEYAYGRPAKPSGGIDELPPGRSRSVVVGESGGRLLLEDTLRLPPSARGQQE